MYRVVDKIKEKLIENGVNIHFETTVSNIIFKDGKINEVDINGGNKIKYIDSVYWTAGLGSVKVFLI